MAKKKQEQELQAAPTSKSEAKARDTPDAPASRGKGARSGTKGKAK